MTLNLISNRAAAVANRALAKTSAQVTNSIRKLSSGSRVESARDDAAAMAIGSRLRSELVALRQVELNATQATSLLQIAEGTIGQSSEMLYRLKALATQAGSANLSNSDRDLLDVEFQQLLNEVDRVANDTRFNGNQLVAAAQVIGGTAIGGSGSFAIADGVIDISAVTVPPTTAGPPIVAYTIAYADASNTFTVTETTSGDTWTGAVPTFVTGNALDQAMDTGYTVKLTGATNSPAGFLTISLDGTFDTTTAVPAEAMTITGTGKTDLKFKIGTGANPAEDEIAISMQGVSQEALGLTGANIRTIKFADAASTAIDLAVDTVITARSETGSTQNRVEATAANIAITIENIDAARSAYLDLNVAQEISTFTAKQVLQQAGVSIASQANQLPQNLLQLFQ